MDVTNSSVRPDWRRRLRAALNLHARSALALPRSLKRLAGGAGPGGRRTGGRLPTLVGLPVDLAAFVLVVAFWALFLTRGVLYPVFGADNLESSWGGPSLAGAWLAHFAQGPPLLVLVTLVLRALERASAALRPEPATPSRHLASGSR